MDDRSLRTAAATFAQDWHGRGNEKSDTQTFWLSLLVTVFGLKPTVASSFIQFEKGVERAEHIGYIDAYIPSTKVLIEQKSLGVDLDKAFSQAKDYADCLPYDERPRWIVVSDFATFRVYDMNHPFAAPEVIALKNLAKESHRLKFLVDTGSAALKREEEISLAAGRIIGELYDEFLKLYGENPTEADLRNLNVLCVRIVFCLYAEDAGILPKNAFHDYLNKFVSSDIRVAMRDFFETLNTRPEERGRFLDPDLAQLPYVNGGLFGEGGEEAKNRVSTDQSAPSARSAGDKLDIPPFSTAMRQLLLQKASLNFDWSAISPTIFGAVFESTLNPETRRKGGMHYTSVENIHKVIDPLFLDALWKEFGEIVGEESISRKAAKAQRQGDEASGQGNEASGFVKRGKGYSPCTKPYPPNEVSREAGAMRGEASSPWSVPLNEAGGFVSLGARLCARNLSALAPSRVIDKKTREKLLAFQSKLASLTFLDPACGSGNFLTETYLSLRRLENEVLKILLAGQSELDLGDLVRVSIHQFYGIEINDFAVTVAKTALWIAESQMLKETEDILHRSLDFLPLKTYSNIVEANALTLDWESVVPRDKLSYIIGNPPFVGARYMSAAQKADLVGVFGAKWKNVGNLDFVTAWYKKAADLMRCEVGGKGLEVRGKGLEVRGKGLEVGGKGLEVGGKGLEVGGKGDEVGGKRIRAALVSTNSICQGESVVDLWKPLMAEGVTIDFAWRTFRWDSESVGKAHVHCVIVGFSCGGGDVSRKDAKAQRQGDEAFGFVSKEFFNNEAGGFVSLGARLCARNLSALAPSCEKTIFSASGRAHPAANINPYLIDAPNIFIESRSKPLCDVPRIGMGNQPIDDGNYLFTDEEKAAFLAKEPAAAPLFRKWYGAVEFINRKPRWCLWLGDCTPAQLRAMPHCYARVASVREFRLKSTRASTLKLADRPTRFQTENMPDSDYLLIPKVSSERRRYVPIGFMDKADLASDLVFIIPHATLYHFGVLTSSVHMAWMRAVCGRLEMSYRYSKDVVYNNFPWPEEGDGFFDFSINRFFDWGGKMGEGFFDSSINRFLDWGGKRGEGFFECKGEEGESQSKNRKVEESKNHDWRTPIVRTAQAILDARARYPDSSLADLYDELTMPPDLRAAHEANDRAVLAAYGFQGNEAAGFVKRTRETKPPASYDGGKRYSPLTKPEASSPWLPEASSPWLPEASSPCPSESAIVAALMRRYQALCRLR